MPPQTPSATFIRERRAMSYEQPSTLTHDWPKSKRAWLLEARDSQLATKSAFLSDGLVEHFSGGFDRGSLAFRNHPLHLAGFDFILRDPAWLTRERVDHRRR